MTTKKDEPKASYPELDEGKPEIAEPSDPLKEPHPDYPGLTRGQVETARANARKKLETARVKAAMQRAEDAELQRLKMEEGVTVGGAGKLAGAGEKPGVAMIPSISAWLAALTHPGDVKPVKNRCVPSLRTSLVAFCAGVEPDGNTNVASASVFGSTRIAVPGDVP